MKVPDFEKMRSEAARFLVTGRMKLSPERRREIAQKASLAAAVARTAKKNSAIADSAAFVGH